MFQAQKQGNCLYLCLNVCKYCSIPYTGTNFNTALIFKTPVDSKQDIRRIRKVKDSTFPKLQLGLFGLCLNMLYILDFAEIFYGRNGLVGVKVRVPQ
jgi:hypothetical protein